MLVCRCMVLLVCWLVLGHGVANAQPVVDARLKAYFDKACQEGTFNGNVLIVDRGKTVLRQACGYADGTHTRHLQLSDRFDIGSIAKEFDAVAILMLVQERKLSLSDPVSKFVPDLPAWAKTVKIDDLMHYTSGLPDVDWNTANSDADMLKTLQALDRLDFPAGTHYAYNNNNTFLRRRIVERASGMRFEEFLTSREFPKAGIRDAVIDPTEASPRIARSFDAQGKTDPMILWMTGWTALTVDDLLRWSDCITNFCLISPASTRQIVTTEDLSWQTGLGHGEMAGDRLMRHIHDGNDHNFEALLVTDAAKGRTIILLTNKNRQDVDVVAHAINAILDDASHAGPGAP